MAFIAGKRQLRHHRTLGQPIYQRLGFLRSLWWIEELIVWTESANGQTVEATIGTPVLKSVLSQARGIESWNKLMQRWDREDFFLMYWNRIEDPPFILHLDFSGADFLNQNLDGIDLRFAWLDGANFSGSSLQHAKFDFSCLTETNFSDVDIFGASFRYSFHQPQRPPLGLSDDLLKENEVYEDEVSA